MQTANPGNLESPKLAMVMNDAFSDELEQILKEAGAREVFGAVRRQLTKPIDGTPDWLLTPAKRISSSTSRSGAGAQLKLRKAALPSGVHDVSGMAKKFGLNR